MPRQCSYCCLLPVSSNVGDGSVILAVPSIISFDGAGVKESNIGILQHIFVPLIRDRENKSFRTEVSYYLKQCNDLIQRQPTNRPCYSFTTLDTQL